VLSDGEDIFKQSTLASTSELGTSISDNTANSTSETNVHAHNYLRKVLSRKEGAGAATSRRKRSTKSRSPKTPLVCVPCKKHFNRRSKLDQHNRLEHDTDVRYSCDGCHKMFSRRDHVVRHVRNGHCHAGQSNASTELYMDADDTTLLTELSMLILLFLEPH